MAKSATITAYSEAAANLPQDAFLGQIVLFTITEVDVYLDTVREQVAQRNLRTDLLKARIRPIDAFKRATSDIATRFAQEGSERHSLLVRPVGHDKAEAHRHVVYERAIFQPNQPRRVLHETVWKIIYDRGQRGSDGRTLNDNIFVEQQPLLSGPFTAEERQWIEEYIGRDGRRLRERFKHYCTHLDSNAIRAFVREYLTALGAINVKIGGGGGLYFVQQKHVDELRDLTELVIDIGSYMHTIPLLDIVSQRDMLADAFIADTLEELRQTSAEISKILVDKSRTITEATYDMYASQAAALIARAKEYENLLGRNLDTATLEVDLFRAKTLNLADRVRKPKSLGGGK